MIWLPMACEECSKGCRKGRIVPIWETRCVLETEMTKVVYYYRMCAANVVGCRNNEHKIRREDRCQGVAVPECRSGLQDCSHCCVTVWLQMVWGRCSKGCALNSKIDKIGRGCEKSPICMEHVIAIVALTSFDCLLDSMDSLVRGDVS